MPDTTDQLIFRMGIEGGIVRFFRHSINRVDYEYSFIVSAGDEERLASATLEPSIRFATLDKAILAFSPSNEWVFFHPAYVHYAYRQQVWNLREQILSTLPPEVDRAHPLKRTGRWERACRTTPSASRESRPQRPRQTPFDKKVLAAAVAIVEHLKGQPMTADEATAFKTAIFESIERQLATDRERNRPTPESPPQPAAE